MIINIIVNSKIVIEAPDEAPGCGVADGDGVLAPLEAAQDLGQDVRRAVLGLSSKGGAVGGG